MYLDRTAAACVAHARRKFDELAKAGTSALSDEAIRRFGFINEVEGEMVALHDDERRARRDELAWPL